MNNEKRERIVKNNFLLFPKGMYFECEDGWLDIIESLSDSLERLIELYVAKYPDDEIYPTCAQVKEKYGTLRFYMHTETDEMSKLIDQAEEESSKTCEICGKPGKLNNGPWYTTYCPDHMET